MDSSRDLNSSSSSSSSVILGMTGGPTIRAQLDSLSMTVHEVVGRVELTGRTVVNLEEDRDLMKKIIEAQEDILNQRILAEVSSSIPLMVNAQSL